MITVEINPGSTRVTIPSDDVSPDRLRPFLDWLRLEAVVHRSQLSEAEAERMAEEAKAQWWAKNKAHFTQPTEQ